MAEGYFTDIQLSLASYVSSWQSLRRINLWFIVWSEPCIGWSY